MPPAATPNGRVAHDPAAAGHPDGAGGLADVADRLVALELQGREILATLRALVSLMTPQDDAERRDSLGEALAEIIALERRILKIALSNQGSLRSLTAGEGASGKQNGLHQA
jgi:hypothetical protein